MPSVYPHSPADLAIAPVLIQLERNLDLLRRADDLVFELALELNDTESLYETPRSRAERVVRAATRNVSLHGLVVSPTLDLQGLSVAHGEYRVSLMLGGPVAAYVELGAPRPVLTR